MSEEQRFKLVGGKCDGETVTMPTRWDGRGHRPPPMAQAVPREPLPPVPWPVPTEAEMTAKVTVETYHLHVFDKDNHRWFEYHPEPQE